MDDAARSLVEKGLVWLESATWRPLQRALRSGPWILRNIPVAPLTALAP